MKPSVMAISPQAEARRAVDELAANGATFHYRTPDGAMPATFTYSLTGEGRRQRCRQIIGNAKANPKVWAAVLAEIAARTGCVL